MRLHWLRRATACGIAIGITLGAVVAGSPAHDTVETAAIRTALAVDIEEREPVWTDTVFDPFVGLLFCWNRFAGLTAPTTIYHVWVYEGREVARVPLDVASANWRTWSAKEIAPDQTGDWNVRIEDSHGTELECVSFRIGAGWRPPLDREREVVFSGSADVVFPAGTREPESD